MLHSILYFPLPTALIHWSWRTLAFRPIIHFVSPPNFAWTIVLGVCSPPKRIWKTIVYVKFGGKTKCIMGRLYTGYWKIENTKRQVSKIRFFMFITAVCFMFLIIWYSPVSAASRDLFRPIARAKNIWWIIKVHNARVLHDPLWYARLKAVITGNEIVLLDFQLKSALLNSSLA